MKNHIAKNIGVAFVATYPPRQCGIGTFTQDLVKSLSHFFRENHQTGSEDNLQVIAMNNRPPEGYNFPPKVYFEIRDHYKGDYQRAASFINLSVADVVSLQHEFGIYGGPDGSHILHLLNNLKKPVVTTLHTVLQEPSPTQERTLKNIISLSTQVVVLADKAIETLKTVYDTPEEKIVMIPHGAPDVPFLDTSYYKDQFQADGRHVILSFGLLSPNKGIEYVIEAMAQVIQEFPDAMYIVLGATHPEVKRMKGEQYRLSLERRVKELGLEQHVAFHNHFVSLEQLIQFLVAADIYVTPYLAREQIVSGTLAYALACGKAIISTPYWYAEELLADERGCLVPFKDSNALAETLIDLLGDEAKRNKLRKNAYQFGRKMIWREVGKRYAAVFEQALIDYRHHAQTTLLQRKPLTRPTLPEIRLKHLYTLTDDTGILQHADYSIPDRDHGYCTDDNARALMVALMNYQVLRDEKVFNLLNTYLSFVSHAIDKKTNMVRNLMSYDRKWLEKSGSEDSHGRTILALGYAVYHAPDPSILGLATHLFKLILKKSISFAASRAQGYAALGCFYYLKRFGGDTEVKNIAAELAQKLFVPFRENSSPDWPWFEDILTYANARIPQALISLGHYLRDKAMLQQGLQSLEWLLQIQTEPKSGVISLIGNSNWYRRGGEKSQFDQQPIEIAALVDACYQAFIITNKNIWLQEMERAFAWFFGKNIKGLYLYDFRNGACYDGLGAGGINMNQGAESTLSLLSALHLMHQVSHKGVVLSATNIAEALTIDFQTV
ncbi:MAG: glycosyltransferase [Calditrichaeota bacterium]|nr:glycosyltransferase [Calditrichota bacterium]